MSINQTQPIKMAPYKIQTVSLHELVSGSELIEFLRVEIPYGEAYGRIPFARVLYAFNGIEQEKAVPKRFRGEHVILDAFIISRTSLQDLQRRYPDISKETFAENWHILFRDPVNLDYLSPIFQENE